MNDHSDTNDDLDMMLSEVYIRHERILELEQDIQDLTAISKDIQSMVTEQQIIDSIDHQVEVAVDHVCHATVHVRRRRRCCIQ
jgi:t-SNARE complex subunit (syntaxin)